MKVAIYARPHMPHQVEAAALFSKGLRAHGVSHEVMAEGRHVEADLFVCWGWRIGKELRKRGNVLIMERGHLPERQEWISCGFNGLANAGVYCAPDNGQRWAENFSHLYKPWKAEADEGENRGYALLVGQVPGDESLGGLNVRAWAEDQARALQAMGHDVRYRPHPNLSRNGDAWAPQGCGEASQASLADDLAGAALCVTYSSTTGVESVLAGVPTVTLSEGAMAWPVSAHSLEDAGATPDRTDWCNRMAWCQFKPEEIESGFAWEHLSQVEIGA